MSLRGLSLFLKYYYSNPPQKLFKPQVATNETGDSSTTPKPSCAKLEKIFNEPKFWKFSRDNSLKVNFPHRFKQALHFSKSFSKFKDTLRLFSSNQLSYRRGAFKSEFSKRRRSFHDIPQEPQA